MLGWEFAPFVTGGLGRACEKIVDELIEIGHEVDFVFPKCASSTSREGLRIFGIEDFPNFPREGKIKLQQFVGAQKHPAARTAMLEVPLMPYSSYLPDQAALVDRASNEAMNPYAGNLFATVESYANLVVENFADPGYDAIHAHDWLTFPAAQILAGKLGIPFVAHFHSLESDRNPHAPNQLIMDIEQSAVENASIVVSVSSYTVRCLQQRYGLNPEVARVVHNGSNTFGHGDSINFDEGQSEPQVLFVGRLTAQKGVQNLCAIAQEVLKLCPQARFVIAGEGDLAGHLKRQIQLAGLAEKFELVGLLQGPAVSEAYKKASVLMMPSLSEPFGLVATEATEYGLATVLSISSGVSEILPHAFRADPSDPQRFGQMVSLLLKNPEVRKSVAKQSRADMAAHTWKRTAKLISNVYSEAVRF